VSATSFLTVMAMLALVLGAMGIALRLLRRYTLAGSAGKGGVKMEVLQRLTLGQRQGIALVRVGGRVLVVSHGDGGVHQIAELSEADIAAPADPAKPAAPALDMITGGLRKLALVRDHATEKAAATPVPQKRISYVAPMADFQAALRVAMSEAKSA
jgi:flagellar biogenesis protein FliO